MAERSPHVYVHDFCPCISRRDYYNCFTVRVNTLTESEMELPMKSLRRQHDRVISQSGAGPWVLGPLWRSDQWLAGLVCWSSRIQILCHTSKQSTGCLQPVGVFNAFFVYLTDCLFLFFEWSACKLDVAVHFHHKQTYTLYLYLLFSFLCICLLYI